VSGSRLLDRPLAAARARIAGLGLVATEDQLYYELCRVLQPVRWRRKRPGFLVPPPVPRAAFAAALARAGGPDPVPATVAMAQEFIWLGAYRPAGFAWMTQDLHPTGAVGDATRASAAKGDAALAHGAAAFVELLREIDRFDLQRLQDGPLPS